MATAALAVMTAVAVGYMIYSGEKAQKQQEKAYKEQQKQYKEAQEQYQDQLEAAEAERQAAIDAEQEERERQAALRAKGGLNVATSGMGVLGEATTSQPTLLGG